MQSHPVKTSDLCDVEKMKQKAVETFMFKGFLKIRTASQYLMLQKFKCSVV